MTRVFFFFFNGIFDLMIELNGNQTNLKYDKNTRKFIDYSNTFIFMRICFSFVYCIYIYIYIRSGRYERVCEPHEQIQLF